MTIHEKCGWIITDVVPLKLTKTKDGSKWEKLKSSEEITERHFNIIELSKENLLENIGDIEYKILV